MRRLKNQNNLENQIWFYENPPQNSQEVLQEKKHWVDIRDSAQRRIDACDALEKLYSENPHPTRPNKIELRTQEINEDVERRIPLLKNFKGLSMSSMIIEILKEGPARPMTIAKIIAKKLDRPIKHKSTSGILDKLKKGKIACQSKKTFGFWELTTPSKKIKQKGLFSDEELKSLK